MLEKSFRLVTMIHLHIITILFPFSFFIYYVIVINRDQFFCIIFDDKYQFT